MVMRVSQSTVNTYLYNMLYSGKNTSRSQSTAQTADDYLNTWVNARTGFSQLQYQAEQKQYRNQISDFAKDAAALKKSTKEFYNSNITGEKIASEDTAVTKLINSVNEVSGDLQADNVTAYGEGLLQGLYNQFTGARRNEYQRMGITLDKDTGSISVNNERLGRAVKNDPDGVKRLLSGSDGLAAAAYNLSNKALNASSAIYFSAPNASNYLNYGYNFGTSSQTSYNFLQGMFLNMLV